MVRLTKVPTKVPTKRTTSVSVLPLRPTATQCRGHRGVGVVMAYFEERTYATAADQHDDE